MKVFGSEILYEDVLICISLLQNKILNATNFRKQTAESFLQISTQRFWHFFLLSSHYMYVVGVFSWVGWLIGFNVLWWLFCLVCLGFKLRVGGGFVVVVCFFLSLFYPKYEIAWLLFWNPVSFLGERKPWYKVLLINQRGGPQEPVTAPKQAEPVWYSANKYVYCFWFRPSVQLLWCLMAESSSSRSSHFQCSFSLELWELQSGSPSISKLQLNQTGLY